MTALIQDETITNDVLALVEDAGPYGITVAEVREAVPANHHGTLSGILSLQHKHGNIARLAEKRGGCKIYVDLGEVNGRPTEAQGRGLNKDEIEFAMGLIESLEYWMQVDTASRFGTDRTKAERNAPQFVREVLKAWKDKP